LAGKIDGAIEAIELGGCNQIESLLTGGGLNGFIAGLFEGAAN
jgi:hypothetical protein